MKEEHGEERAFNPRDNSQPDEVGMKAIEAVGQAEQSAVASTSLRAVLRFVEMVRFRIWTSQEFHFS